MIVHCMYCVYTTCAISNRTVFTLHVSCSISGHRYIELFLLSRPGGGGGGREGGEFGGRGGLRGGASGSTRYPTQASWTDSRDTQVTYMYMYTCIYAPLILYNVHVHVGSFWCTEYMYTYMYCTYTYTCMCVSAFSIPTLSVPSQGMYGTSSAAAPQQPQQYMQQTYTGYQQQHQQSAQQVAGSHQWPQQV